MMNLLSAEMFNVEQLRRLTTPKIFQEGKQDYEQHRVRVGSVTGSTAWVEVRDQKSHQSYQVRALATQGQIGLICTCRAGHAWSPCRHRVAAFLALRDHLKLNPPKLWKTVLDQAKQTPAARSGNTTHGPVVFSLQQTNDRWSVVPYWLPARAFSTETLETNEAVARHIEAAGLSTEAKPIRSRIHRASYPLASTEAIAAANLAVGNPYAYGYGYGRDADPYYESVFAALPHCLVYFGDVGEPLGERVNVRTDGILESLLTTTSDGLRLTLQVRVGEEALALHRNNSTLLTFDPMWLLVDNLLVQVSNGDAFTRSLIEYPDIVIPAQDQEEFFDGYLLPLTERMPLQGDSLSWEEVRATPEPRLYLSEVEGEFQAELRFGYGETEFAYDKRAPEASVKRRSGTAQLVRVYRDLAREQDMWQALSSYGLKRGTESKTFLLRRGTDTVDFLMHQIPRLAEAGFTIFGEESITAAKINRNKPTISFNVSSGIDWFDVHAEVNYGDLAVKLGDIRKAIKKREKYIKLADGTIGALPEEWLEKYRHLFAFGQEEGDELRFSNHHLTLIDQLLGDADRTQADAEFERRREKLRSFESIQPHPLPDDFAGELRPYQKAGYDWLHFLRDYHFGGCLADDMGTGKSVQTLAFLQSLYEGQDVLPATLLVMPRSLLFNWQREAERFTPKLQVYVHADQGRITEPAEFGKFNLVLTTYGTMLRDIELLRQYNFHYVILDESQAIKNPLAETSKAARLLQGEHRLALTGTPVENSTSELWSQFAFLNPGLLGNLDYFRNEFVTPIERHQNGDTAQFLRKMVYPFILRRTKDQVASDLPPRTERVLVCEMEKAQQKLYAKQRDYYRALLLGLIDDDGVNDARMKILEGLLRLRQICNHPRLVDSKFKGASGKFELLIDTLETLRSEGHRALVFSQFVQMLTLVREALDARGIPYAYLDGQTTNRQQAVDRFQQDDTLPFFLISLKAGGVGLNLTAADYVIHIDPWWNPAVEMQATDRTHRIGQDKPVFVYKLVVKDTVEEKILQLQEQKRALVEQIIGAEGGVFKALTRADVEVLFS